MSAPTPHKISNSLDELRESIPEIKRLYKDAHEYSLDRPDQRRAHRHTDPSLNVRRQPGSDPTGEIVVGQVWTRSTLDRVGRKVDHLKRDAKSIESTLQKLLEGQEDEFESLDELLTRRQPTVIDEEKKKELNAAYEAQHRRELLEDIVRHEAALIELRRELRETRKTSA